MAVGRSMMLYGMLMCISLTSLAPIQVSPPSIFAFYAVSVTPYVEP